MKPFKICIHRPYIKVKIPFPFIDIYYFNWNEQTKTPIHNHAKKGCLMFLFKGVLKEKIYNKDINIIERNIYKSPSLSYITNKKGYHSIQPLVHSKSIHFYYPKGHITKNIN